jgi:peptidoglycan hydrolase-like amidase
MKRLSQGKKINDLGHIQREPLISVGLMTGVRDVSFQVSGEFAVADGHRLSPGSYKAVADGPHVQIRHEAGNLLFAAPEIELMPGDFSSSVFTLANVTIGMEFHWQRQQEQSFRGTLKLVARPGQGLTAINQIPLESYLTSVISSEMSASSPPEFLKAHAVISRSWLLAQLQGPGIRDQGSGVRDQGSEGRDQGSAAAGLESPQSAIRNPQSAIEIIRWYSRESHTDFDVCADDHCQRYQGITKTFSPAVFDAIQETRGVVLVSGDEICDARFSKCCGGMTENYRTAWEDVEVPYLVGVYDGPNAPAPGPLPLMQEAAAEQWIVGSPSAYCHTSDRDLLQQILPDFDQETQDFFRWEVSYEQDELRAIVERKLNIELGSILGWQPLARGVSGRIVRLKITGEKASVVVGKELEIRRALSRTHLYSSAFIVRPEGEGTVPEWFRLIGAGWGHGVGLCQIGAAVMAQQGRDYREILAHYYRGSALRVLYES